MLVESDGHLAKQAFLFSPNATCLRRGRAGDALTDHHEDNISSEVNLSTRIIDVGSFVLVHLALSFNSRLKDVSRKFVFGSDQQTCDVLLAEEKTSVGNCCSASIMF